MAISDRTRRILWSRSGNRCAICKTHLVEAGTDVADAAVVGDECHIVARNTGGPRGGLIDAKLLDDVSNLILLCKTHHKLVDDQVEEYTPEALRSQRTEHEDWVDRTLDVALETPAPEGQVLMDVEKRLLRIEFLQESVLPLRSLLFVVDLRTPASTAELGHFRALMTLCHHDRSEEHTLCVGGRDAYSTQTSGNTTRELFGNKLLNWVEEPTRILQQTIISHGQSAVAQIVLQVGLRHLPAFQMLHDLSECHTSVYLTEPLWERTSGISVVAGDYMLASFSRGQLAVLNGNPSVQWPETLNQPEEAIPWRPILPRGADYPRYESEGESADWFPARLYGPWLLDPTLSTPTRIRPHGLATERNIL